MYDRVPQPRLSQWDGTKWGLISYTMAMFSFATAYTAIKLHTLSTSSVGNRGFADPNGTLVGPHGYQSVIRLTELGVIANLVYLLNNLLADGLLVC